jgi:uroporphyrinogen decarboxylase
MTTRLLTTPHTPDWEGLLNAIQRRPIRRAHHIEQHIDSDVVDAVIRLFGLADGRSDEEFAPLRRQVAALRFLGYDCVICDVDGIRLPMPRHAIADTSKLSQSKRRAFVEEGRGPITTWQEFDAYHWPDPRVASTRSLEWLQKNLPDDMCIAAGGGLGHVLSWTSFLMGYETLCYAIYDQPDLVSAIVARLMEIFKHCLTLMLQFDRVKLIWGKDDMGFRNGTLLSPKHLRQFFLPGHEVLAKMVHAAGRPYLLHSDGDLDAIMADLIGDVRIDAKHAFEDTIEDVRDAKAAYGQRIALLGGIDVDFLCRAGETQIRQRVRATLDVCLQGSGYCLGSGNSIPVYMPLANYLAMLDEGRRYAVSLI